MRNIYLAMERELLVVGQQHGTWLAEPHLVGMPTTCIAHDPFHPERVYCGTFGRGLWRSTDAGHNWQPVGDAGSAMGPWHDDGISHAQITSVAVSATDRPADYGVVYVGTEPTALFRSDDGGDSWKELSHLRTLPSAPTWSFPPRPYTSHARWITPDPYVAGRVFVAIEAGALVHSLDGGEHWEDRRPDGPIDTHTLVMHPEAPNRLYSAAGDGFSKSGRGYNESFDGGETWQRPDEGLRHHYLWSVAVDPANVDTVVVSASHSPMQAHTPSRADSVIYRKQRGEHWRQVTQGLPASEGTVTPLLTSNINEPGVFYALLNQGLFRSSDTGLTWEQLPVPWKQDYRHQHQQALLVSDL